MTKCHGLSFLQQFSSKPRLGLKKRKLKSDPQCGRTTGGREECWWDCRSKRFAGVDITGFARKDFNSKNVLTILSRNAKISFFGHPLKMDHGTYSKF